MTYKPIIVPKKDELKCIICKQKFPTAKARNFHIKEEHGLTYEEYIVNNYFNGEYPLCQCGCGTKMKFMGSPFGNWFNEYSSNHFPRKKHTIQTKKLIKENTKKAIQEKFGVNNVMEIQEFRDKIKTSKKEIYGDAHYNNTPKNKNTTLKNSGYQSNFVNPFYRKKYILKKSKYETIVSNAINGEHQFHHNGYIYDVRINDIIFEIDGDFFHPSTLTNLTLIQINSIYNDMKKAKALEGSPYKLYKIHVSNIPKDITIDNLIANSYQPNYKLDYKQIFLTKNYLSSYIDAKGKDKLKKYISIITNFIKTIQPTFPYPTTIETQNDINKRISIGDLDNNYNNHIFKHNCSDVGLEYIKSNFKSYWNSSFKNKLTPVQVWDDYNKLLKIVEYRIGCNNSNEVFDISLHQIIKGINAARYSVSIFKPYLAASIYNHYIPKDILNPIVIDPCCGFGGRLLGFKSLYPNGTYIGCEPNVDTYNELINISKDMSNVQIYNMTWESFVEQYNPKDMKYDLIFTSIPYFDLETYSTTINYNNFDEWKDKFINTFNGLNNCYINMSNELCFKLGLHTNIIDSIELGTSHFNQNNETKYEVIVKF